MILKALNKCFPFPSNSVESKLHQYVADNQQLSWLAIQAIETGDVTALAKLMRHAQVKLILIIVMIIIVVVIRRLFIVLIMIMMILSK